MKVFIRKAKRTDLSVLSKLAIEFADVNPSPSTTAQEDFKNIQQSLDILLSRQHTKVLVAEVSDKVVGVMVLAFIPSLVHGSRNVIYIDLIVVDKDFRRKGIAKTLVREAIKIAGSSNAYKVLLVSRKGNVPAQRLYESCCFKENGIAFAYYI